ncbi:energy transducer TonB [Taibaiella soli]|nr:energy transducer TonB [Taibaiella soli]
MKRTIALLSAAVLLAVSANAQSGANQKKQVETFSFVEQMPEFPGGSEKLQTYLATNIHYPDSARNANKEGRVIVRFEVMEDGSIVDAKVMSPYIGLGLEEEALRVVSSMPKWKPGKSGGKSVKVYYTLPIRFRLEDEPKKKG